MFTVENRFSNSAFVGFSAKLAGHQSWGNFVYNNERAVFWTSTWAGSFYNYNIRILYDGNGFGNAIETGANPAANTMSIRCVQD